MIRLACFCSAGLVVVELCADLSGRRLWVCEHNLVADAHDSVAGCPQHLVTLSVVLHRPVVDSSVDLDHQPGRAAHEVDDEALDDELPREPRLVAAERVPQRLFCGRRVAPQLSRSLALHVGSDSLAETHA